MKSHSIDWSSFLLALALAFAIALSPLVHWIYGALGLPAEPFSEVAFFVAFVLIWMMLRAFRRWHELADLQRQGGAASYMTAQLVRTVVFTAIICGGLALFIFLLGDWLRQGGFWELVVTELLIFGAVCKAATWAADFAGNLIWNGARIEKTRAPDGAALIALPKPFVVGSARAEARFSIAIFAALGAVCLLAYAFVFVAALGVGTAPPAPTWALVGLVLLLSALLCWWQCAPFGQVSSSQIRPRFGRAFPWWNAVTVEEARVNRFLEDDKLYLIFRAANGAVLWQLPVDQLEFGDKRQLWRLFPEVAKGEVDPVDGRNAK